MKLIVALGNPGPRYEVTRHNIGWLLLDYCMEKWGVSTGVTKHQAEVFQFQGVKKSGASGEAEPVLLIKPQTFMNLSGRAVAPIAQFYKCKSEDIIVLHDELDLNPFQMKIKKGGGHAGHNGLKSLEAELGTRDYYRVRLGIGHPRTVGSRMEVGDYVLSRFTQEDCNDWEKVFENGKKALELMCAGEVLKAMNQFNVNKE